MKLKICLFAIILNCQGILDSCHAEIHWLTLNEDHTVTDPESPYNGIKIDYGDLMAFGVEQTDAIEFSPRIGFRILNIIDRFRRNKPFEELSLDDQVARLFGTVKGVYAANLTGHATAATESQIVPADKDLPGIIGEHAETEDRDRGFLEKLSGHWSRNWDRYASTGAGLVGGSVGAAAIDGSDGGKRKEPETDTKRRIKQGADSKANISSTSCSSFDVAQGARSDFNCSESPKVAIETAD